MISADVCRKKLQGFVDQVCHGQSPLYEHVCRQILSDQDTFELMQHTPALQPGPNLFLAAIHFLLLRGAPHELREFYGSCTDQPRSASEAWPAFREFCLSHHGGILDLMNTKQVQTNEVGRCSYLFPAFSLIHRRQPDRPLAIIEIGASAGLNLNWDRYAYDYAGLGAFGNRSSRVAIRSEWRGACPTLDEMPSIVHRVGIDLHPVDVSDADQAVWLQALLWPDQPERLQLQRAAIDDFRDSPARLVAGDALQELTAQVDQMPAHSQLCILHSHTLNQFTDEQRAELTRQIQSASHCRPIHVVSAEWIKTLTTELHWRQWNEGQSSDKLLARVDHHGRWIEWLT